MSLLPDLFTDWFENQGWQPHAHQLDLLARAHTPATVLIAPTGGGKTLAGFLPSLVELAADPKPGMHTLYVSPLKALAADIKRNLRRPVEEMGLDLRIEDRTGDTKQSARLKQRKDPPHILLTTPESLSLLLSYEDAHRIFAGLQRVVVDEIHALAEGKRGDQLMLCLARLQRLLPQLRRVGLSATVEDPPRLARFLAPEGCDILKADPGPEPQITLMEPLEPPPWAGAGGRYAARDVLDEIRKADTTLVFINTRAQAELFFQALWAENNEGLPIGIHHGSLSREAREKVEAAMVAGELRAIVCTGSLDLGIDWGNVDLVIQIGAPKNVKRLVQRIGRAGHRYNTPSRAILVPANRFEVVECHAALEAVFEGDLDRSPRTEGPLDVLCQHVLLMACSAPFTADALYEEIRTAGPYCDLSRAAFDQVLDFCATGGYALRAYDRWQRLVERDGTWQLRDPRAARSLRMNIGTILDQETLGVKIKGRGGGGASLGEVEEAFAATLVPGDTFLIGGQTVRYEGLRELVIEVTREPGREPKIAVFGGYRMATSLELSNRFLDILQDRTRWAGLPQHTQDWLDLQTRISTLPEPGRLLSESFRRADRHYFALYSFAGRNANQTLGLLLTRRMEDANLGPLGFVSTDYAVLVWSLHPVEDPAPLLRQDDLRADLETWLGENAVMKRTFRASAIIAGLIERNQPGKRKTGRQATFSSDILYDTLRRFDPEHLMLKITREEAARGLVDFERIEEMLRRTSGRHTHIKAPHITPFAAPLLLEHGRIPIKGMAEEQLLETETTRMLEEAGLNQLRA
ncbi:MAG: ligase-associated DNA damage response DEXH box helicase [Pseudomonadota bacterium]